MMFTRMIRVSCLISLIVCGMFVGSVWAAESAEQLNRSDTTPVVTRNVPYREIPGVDANQLSVDIYSPPEAKPHPVIAFIHGGGWRVGDKANAVFRKNCHTFAMKGYVCISVNYRLTPAGRHPENIQDIAAALLWIKEHIADYNGDPSTLFVVGHSAGAHLAALVGLDQRWLKAAGDDLSLIKGLVLLDTAAYDIPELMKQSGEKLIHESAFGANPETWIDASPALHLENPEQIPPTLVVYTGRRVDAREQSMALSAKLKQLNVPHQVIHAADQNHAGINSAVGDPDSRYHQLVTSFLQAPAQVSELKMSASR